MNKTILFPFDTKRGDFRLYCLALHFATNRNSTLNILTVFNRPKTILRSTWNYKKFVEKEKERLYLSLLEMNGVYNRNINKWNTITPIKVTTDFNEGNLTKASLHRLLYTDVQCVLFDHNAFSNMILSIEVLKLIASKKMELWIMHLNNEFSKFDTDHSLRNIEDSLKNPSKEIFTNLIQYKLPQDKSILESNYRPYLKDRILLKPKLYN